VSLSDQLQKASDQLKSLADRATKAEADANAAKTKTKAALDQQVADAQTSAKQTADALKAKAADSRDETTQWWGQVQENWKHFIAKIRDDADAKKADRNAKRAQARAERAEDNAADAVAFAYAALEEAEYQVLNAATARLDADEAAGG
jgi:hypothetical protein